MNIRSFLPPANEVWGKVIFLHLSVILFVGGPGGLVPGGGGCLVPGEVPGPGGGGLVPGECLVETPPDGYCFGRYASYWNAFFYANSLPIAYYLLGITKKSRKSKIGTRYLQTKHCTCTIESRHAKCKFRTAEG